MQTIKRIATVAVDTPEGRALEAALERELRKIPTVEFVDTKPPDEFSFTVVRNVDVMIVGGGDGFLLEMIRACSGEVKAFFGINLGTVGFYMNEFGADSAAKIAKKVVSILVADSYQVVTHRVLKAEIERDLGPPITRLALNDVVIKAHSDECDPTVRLGIKIDGTELPIYSGDGVIFATPGGSTAYSLSAGGSVIDHRVPCFIMTPISPQYSAEFANLSKPVVLAASSKINVVGFETKKRPVRVMADNFVVNKARAVRVSVDTSSTINLLYTPDWNYIRRLSTKIFGVKERRR